MTEILRFIQCDDESGPNVQEAFLIFFAMTGVVIFSTCAPYLQPTIGLLHLIFLWVIETCFTQDFLLDFFASVSLAASTFLNFNFFQGVMVYIIFQVATFFTSKCSRCNHGRRPGRPWSTLELKKSK